MPLGAIDRSNERMASVPQAEEPPKRLESMPGLIRGISYNPLPGSSSILLHTSAAFCHVDLEKALPRGPQAKRRRGRQPPAQESGARGENFRVFVLDNTCLFVGFTGPNSAALLEKPWVDVLKQFPPPVYRHMYGT